MLAEQIAQNYIPLPPYSYERIEPIYDRLTASAYKLDRPSDYPDIYNHRYYVLNHVGSHLIHRFQLFAMRGMHPADDLIDHCHYWIRRTCEESQHYLERFTLANNGDMERLARW